ncbi:MAG: hypothetical protein H6983_19170 [Ectothiorhodospiraceae bacterium]|nr:hypothetical protein [Ectothiorhodospiraceae bacterium]
MQATTKFERGTRTTPPSSRSRRVTVALLVLGSMLAASGCVPLDGLVASSDTGEPARSGSLVAPAPASDPTSRFLAAARPGETGTIHDPVTGRVVDVVVGRRYPAASGRECIPFRAGQSWWLGCQGATGEWRSAPLLTSPGVLEASAAAR